MITAKLQCQSCGHQVVEFLAAIRSSTAPMTECLCKECYDIIMSSNDKEAKEALKQDMSLDYERAMDLVQGHFR